jgi:uncharacterized protein YfdQ (DUF2303 family)
MLPIETLNKITADAVIAAGRSLHTDVPSVLVPHGYSIENIEHLQEFRSRFRGVLNTQSLPDFCDYVIDQSTTDVKLPTFIDAERMGATAFFDLGDFTAPGHAEHRAVLTLKPTAAYSALRKIAGERMSQQGLAEWMEDWNSCLKVTDNQGADIPLSVAVQKIRTITIKATAERTSSENNFSAGRSSMDSIEAAHAEQQPADLLFTTKPYEGLKPVTITLRLSIITGEKPQICPRWVQKEAQEEAIAQDFKDVLKAEIGGVSVLTLGTFSTK